jgi:acyl carrier protein
MIKQRAINIIAEQFNVVEENISEQTSFRDDLNADSLDLVELIMALEDEFELEIEEDEVDSILTVEDSINFIIKNKDK